MDLRSQIQRIALRWPRTGIVGCMPNSVRQGWTVNHKRVLRLMRVDNLLCVRRRKFILTTDSKHGLPIYPNLADGMVLTGIDQLWVADITYIRLQLEFVYLAVLLDAFSRRCIGWALQRSLESGACAGSLAYGADANVAHSRAWCIIPTVACNMPRETTPHNCEQHGIRHQHEPIGNALRQCPRGEFHEDSQVRGSLPHRIPRSRGSQGRDRRSSWRKSTTRSACIRRWAIVRRWSSNAAYDPCQRSGKDEHEFF